MREETIHVLIDCRLRNSHDSGATGNVYSDTTPA